MRLNLSKSGIGFGAGRTGLRIGIDATRRKYFSVGLPGTDLSCRTFFGRPVTPETLKKVGFAVIVAQSASRRSWLSSFGRTEGDQFQASNRSARALRTSPNRSYI